MAETELAFAMRWTRTAAGGRLEQAREFIEDLPAIRAALLAGEIDMPKALVISELVGWLPLDDLQARRAVVDKVIDRACQWTTGQLRTRLRKLILAIDPQAGKKTYATAVKTRRVEYFDNPDGTGELWGRNLPPQDTAAAYERLTAIARAAKAAGDPRPINQLRVDAFLDLLVGEGIATGGPLTHHTGGLPEPTQPATAPEEPATPAAPPPPATEPVPQGWDPAWPLQPWEPISPHDLHPDPTTAPLDRFDNAGQAFDGPDQWPADWPGRWTTDPPWPPPPANRPDRCPDHGAASSNSKCR